eukprot:9203441-Ditylum_brightwellii.AAC.1
MVLLSQVQLVSGSSRPFLEEVYSNWHYVPHSWLSGIRHYLNYASASVTIPAAWCPTLQRENDKMLMDEFETAKPGTATLDHLCRVRLYLGATTMADICDDSGRKIFAWALTGEARCRPMTQCPNQEKPLKYRLWTVSSPSIWRDVYFDHESGTLYVQSMNGCFTQHTRAEGHMSTYTPTQNQLPC